MNYKLLTIFFLFLIFDYNDEKIFDEREVSLFSQNDDENRFLVLGQINSKNYTTIITYREANIRIISVRRSRDKEVKLYESIRAR